MRYILLPMVIFETQCKEAADMMREQGFSLIFNRRLPFNLSEFQSQYGEIEGVICGSETWTPEMIRRLPNLKVMSRFGTGTDNIPIEYLREQKIIGTNTPGTNANAVAEYTLALILALYKNLPACNSMVREGEWKKDAVCEIKGKTVGLIGFGTIAKRLSRLLQAFDCRILAYDPYADPSEAKGLRVTLCEKDQVIQSADILSLHLPLTSAACHSIGSAEFNQMKREAVLINTARGGIVDEQALYEALINGRIKGAAVDVFEQEPILHDHPLLHLDETKFICSSHMGGMSREANARTGMMAAKDVMDVLNGKIPEHRIC